MYLSHSFRLGLICSTGDETFSSLWATNECDIELLKQTVSIEFVNRTLHTHPHEDWVKKD
jgi:hypothetical protein